MMLQTKIDCECVGDMDGYGGRCCEGKITKDCMEAGETGGVCENLCVNKVLKFELKDA